MSEPTAKPLPKRGEIDNRYKWNLEDIYIDIEKWEADYKKIKLMIPEIERFKGTLKKGAQNFLDCLKKCDEISSLMDKLYVYARMKRDEDNTKPEYQALTDKASAIATEVYTAASFIVPEMILIPEKTLNEFVEISDELKIYRHFVKEILRNKEHILPENEEKLLAMASDITDAPHDIFNMLNNADIKFPCIKDENGEEVEVTKGRYSAFLESNDRRVRKDAFHAIYKSYKNQTNTLASLLSNNVKKNKFFSSIRKYDSALQASLDRDNVTTDVYDNLIATIDKNLHLLERYMKLRKKALKLDNLHMYDLYVPIVPEVNKEIKYETALDMVEEGLQPMGEEYLKILKGGFNSGWVDVYENEGKTSGAYSWGAAKTHPYVLLNYQGKINDVMTIAHEMGHAIHTYYSNKTQPYIYSQYRILVAEVASTVNESLVIRHMIENSKNKAEKAYLLNRYLEEFRGTVFRQVMFAEFEKATHAIVEKGEGLTSQMLCQIYRALNVKYYGAEVDIDDDIDYEWSRIPHFYTSFYVYKYATGFSAATSLSKQILNEGKPAIERYTEFLKSGSSDYPLELLKKAGVDLSSAQPIQDALNVFEEILIELEELI
ncbi:MAG: oligoendopeptidase F [Clostridia bacterium]|jgi:oligoendopeptidase F